MPEMMDLPKQQGTHVFNNPIKPINITEYQLDCANIFGIDQDIKFCKMPPQVIKDQIDPLDMQKKEDENRSDKSERSFGTVKKLNLEPRLESCFGISNFC